MDHRQLNAIVKELNAENVKATVKICEIDPEKPFRILWSAGTPSTRMSSNLWNKFWFKNRFQ